MERLSQKQIWRAFALYDSVKKLPESKAKEGLKEVKQFFKDNKIKTDIDPIVALGKLKSKHKIACLKSLVEDRKDKYGLYVNGYVSNSDVIKYLGIDKLRRTTK